MVNPSQSVLSTLLLLHHLKFLAVPLKLQEQKEDLIYLLKGIKLMAMHQPLILMILMMKCKVGLAKM